MLLEAGYLDSQIPVVITFHGGFHNDDLSLTARLVLRSSSFLYMCLFSSQEHLAVSTDYSIVYDGVAIREMRRKGVGK